MTVLQTLRDPKTERLIDDFASQGRIEAVKEMPQELYDQYCRVCRDYRHCSVCHDCHDLIEGQKQEGVADEDILTMAKVVAICKEARAERYARQHKNWAGH